MVVQATLGGVGITRLAIELAHLSGHPARSMARQHKALMEKHLATCSPKLTCPASGRARCSC